MSPPVASAETPNPQAIPKEARGLCWGGFFLTWIWGIRNKVWSSFLVWVPIVGFVVPFVLLFYGREWAWKNQTWESVDEFNASQRRWGWAGPIVFLVVAVLGILSAIAIPNFSRYQVKAQQSEAKVKLLTLYTAEKMASVENGVYTDDLQKLNIPDQEPHRFRVGFASSGPDFAHACPDCTVTPTSFKAVAIGEVGPDHKINVWTIDDKKNLMEIESPF